MNIRRYFRLSRNPILSMIVQYLIANGYNNIGKFKVGDTVVYNWKAKVYISTCIKSNPKRLIKGINTYKDSESAFFDHHWDCVDVFWLKKVKP